MHGAAGGCPADRDAGVLPPPPPAPSPPAARGPRDTGGDTEGRCPSPAPGPRRPVPPPSRTRSPRGRGRVPVSPPVSRPLTMSARAGRRGHGRHAAGGPGLTSEPPHRVTQRRRHDVTAGDISPLDTPKPSEAGQRHGGDTQRIPRVRSVSSVGSPCPSTGCPMGWPCWVSPTMTPWSNTGPVSPAQGDHFGSPPCLSHCSHSPAQCSQCPQYRVHSIPGTVSPMSPVQSPQCLQYRALSTPSTE